MSNAMATDHPRVLFFGMTGNFSAPPLFALLEHGIEVSAVIIPALRSGPGQPPIQHREQKNKARSMLPMLHSLVPASILEIAFERRIPVWEVSRLAHPEAVALLKDYQPDAICVACFSQRISEPILRIPRFGCLNVHPSLLPDNRGPEPLFWTFREGDRQTGVTIHLIDEGMDTGPVLAQEVLEVPDGISYAQLEMQCARLGGALLARSIWELYRGTARSVAQDEAKSSSHPYPTAGDFFVPVVEWDARHVYNFIRGLEAWGEPITLQIADRSMQVKTAISYSDETKLYSQEGEELWVPCRVGAVRIRRS